MYRYLVTHNNNTWNAFIFFNECKQNAPPGWEKVCCQVAKISSKQNDDSRCHKKVSQDEKRDFFLLLSSIVILCHYHKDCWMAEQICIEKRKKRLQRWPCRTDTVSGSQNISCRFFYDAFLIYILNRTIDVSYFVQHWFAHFLKLLKDFLCPTFLSFSKR